MKAMKLSVILFAAVLFTGTASADRIIQATYDSSLHDLSYLWMSNGQIAPHPDFSARYQANPRAALMDPLAYHSALGEWAIDAALKAKRAAKEGGRPMELAYGFAVRGADSTWYQMQAMPQSIPSEKIGVTGVVFLWITHPGGEESVVNIHADDVKMHAAYLVIRNSVQEISAQRKEEEIPPPASPEDHRSNEEHGQTWGDIKSLFQ
jgi:hypothetical protein